MTSQIQVAPTVRELVNYVLHDQKFDVLKCLPADQAPSVEDVQKLKKIFQFKDHVISLKNWDLQNQVILATIRDDAVNSDLNPNVAKRIQKNLQLQHVVNLDRQSELSAQLNHLIFATTWFQHFGLNEDDVYVLTQYPNAKQKRIKSVVDVDYLAHFDYAALDQYQIVKLNAGILKSYVRDVLGLPADKQYKVQYLFDEI